jgi:hypothetical protein
MWHRWASLWFSAKALILIDAVGMVLFVPAILNWTGVADSKWGARVGQHVPIAFALVAVVFALVSMLVVLLVPSRFGPPRQESR